MNLIPAELSRVVLEVNMRPGFSYIGLIFIIMLMAPNILWAKNKPKDYEEYVKNEKKFLLILERIGEVLVTCILLCFRDFNLRTWTAWSWWLVAAFLLMILYEIYWARYFKSEKTMKDQYRSLLIFPVAGATLPVYAAFLLGIYGSNALLMIATVILGIGHIGIHLNHAREAWGKKERRPLALRILRRLGTLVLILFFGGIGTVIGMRNLNYLPHWGNIFGGVEEETYISLNGQEQYVVMMGRSEENPVIVYLHGGPASPDSFVTYSFAEELMDEYTFVCWDERGCGRTYYRNEDQDPNNETATFDQAEQDLDALVDYLRDRFGQEKVVIMGHSYGTILGSMYAQDHPDKVTAYIAVAQMTSLEKTDIYSYNDALERAKKMGDSILPLKTAYDAYEKDKTVQNLMEVRNAANYYHPVTEKDTAVSMAVASPYMGMEDFNWFLKEVYSMDEFVELNRHLLDYTEKFDVYDHSLEYQVPVFFISGSDDWICPVDTVKEYFEAIKAPVKGIELMDGCGHNTQYTRPEEFAELVKMLLKRQI